MKRKVLACTICNTDLPVPLCCKKERVMREGELICNLCNSTEEIPICCGKTMIAGAS